MRPRVVRGKGEEKVARRLAARQCLLKTDKLKSRMYVKSVSLVCTLTQPEVKQLAPPDCAVWRAPSSESWQGHHVKAHKYFTFPWKRYGPEGAARAMIKALWGHWLDWNQLTWAACPIAGMEHWGEALVGSDVAS